MIVMTPAAIAGLSMGNGSHITREYAGEMLGRCTECQRIVFGYDHKWIVSAAHGARFSTQNVRRSVRLKMKAIVNTAQVVVRLQEKRLIRSEGERCLR